MAIFHIEVHSRDRQIEHYIAPNCASEEEAIKRIGQYYADNGQRVGMWDKEVDRNDGRIQHLIFHVQELEAEPVIYISGEYRTQYPI